MDVFVPALLPDVSPEARFLGERVVIRQQRAAFRGCQVFLQNRVYICMRAFGGFRAYVLNALGSLTGRKGAIAELRPPKPARLEGMAGSVMKG